MLLRLHSEEPRFAPRLVDRDAYAARVVQTFRGRSDAHLSDPAAVELGKLEEAGAHSGHKTCSRGATTSKQRDCSTAADQGLRPGSAAPKPGTKDLVMRRSWVRFPQAAPTNLYGSGTCLTKWLRDIVDGGPGDG